MRKIALLALVAATALSAPATAKVFNFGYSAEGISVFGTATTDDTPDADGYYLITGISATRNGAAMTLLTPGTFPANGPNDNLIKPGSSFFTFLGLGFSTDQEYNIFQYAPDIYVECIGACVQNTSDQVFVSNVFVTEAGGVPEPATWAMMIGGFGLVGAAMRRRVTPHFAQA